MVTLLISEHCHGLYFAHFKSGLHQWMKSLSVTIIAFPFIFNFKTTTK